MSAPAHRFRFVDALRGLAALSVAVYHITRYGPVANAACEVLPAGVLVWANHGWAGVQMFFVISGFVIAYSLRRAEVTPEFTGRFVVRRSLRLDPAYWTTIVVMLALAAWLPWIFTDPSLEGEPVTAGQVFAHVGYLQNILGFDNISVGFWTLCIEVQFYLAFVTALGFAPWLAARWGRREQRVDLRPLAWAMLPVALMSLFVFSRDPASDAWLVHYFGYFYFGILAAWVLDDRISARLFWAFATAMALRLGLFGGLDVAVGLASGVAIHLAGRLGKLDAWLTAGWLQRIGRNSYSLYLIHYPVSCLVTAFGLWLTGTQPGYAVLWVLAALAVSMAAAEGLYHLVERPSLELSQRLGTLRPSSRPTPTSVSQFPRPANT